MLGTTLMLALGEIRRHLLRSFLTTLGIIIGVSAVITMVTLGNGVTVSIKEQISALGSNVFIVFPQQTDRGQPRPFKEDDITAVREQIAGVKAVAGEVNRDVKAIHNGQDWSSRVEGVSNAFMDARGIGMDEGRRFTAAEESAGANVCIIGPKVYEEIFVAGTSPIGERMRLDDVSCTVIGMFESRAQGAQNQDDDNSVFMPIKNVQRRFLGNDNVFYMVISYDPAYDSAAMQSSLVDLLRERRLLQEGQVNDFNILDTAQVNDAVSTAVGLLTAMVSAIAAISLVVGGVGIMNIMLVSVTERTREIGIRLAIGALAREVRLQFLTEAVVLCCFGGVMGIVLGFIFSFGLARAVDIPFVFSPTINVLSFLVSALIGVVFGYFPARRAAALDPIEALRHE
ncbi:multidrug ABC transporter substrate-binding protein [Erythrobacter sp. SG61-1L]|uniref:ABC transporter permease n=1 Tax=Erythrobacter sp. SG61-1L TaxID=1603897 RepID=UPI0006C9365A|nr:ABC transporter permease [Erythrobacter sp. SG61-1L]KPL68670.1 multidrug ABC transporter substrate-binding protein [Erythrobacter sp. SG61-1L]